MQCTLKWRKKRGDCSTMPKPINQAVKPSKKWSTHNLPNPWRLTTKFPTGFSTTRCSKSSPNLWICVLIVSKIKIYRAVTTYFGKLALITGILIPPNTTPLITVAYYAQYISTVCCIYIIQVGGYVIQVITLDRSTTQIMKVNYRQTCKTVTRAWIEKCY